jgi:hypothetical protein
MKIRRLDYGQGSGKEEQKLDQSSIPSIGNDQLSLDRLVYRKLGSLTDNKVITRPESADTDFHRFLLDMNNLHKYKYYKDIVSDYKLPTPDIIALDEYLGTLGVTENYPFISDRQDIPAWFDYEEPHEVRVLFDNSDNTYLVDTSDNTVLASYRK